MSNFSGDAQPRPRRPPETDTQRLIAGYWQEVLDLESVSLDDDFVECGGNSLLATMLSHRIQRMYNFRPTLTEIFASTVETMARRCDEEAAKAAAPIDKGS